MSTELGPSRATAQTIAKVAWARRLAYRDPIFLHIEALVWTTRSVWVQFRSKCPRCEVRCTVSTTASVEIAFEPALKTWFRWQWEELLTTHACLVKGDFR